MPISRSHQIRIFPSADSLQHALADTWVALAREAIAERGQFCMALSGGSTPKALYQLMATPAYKDAVDWQHCHLFFGDERFVPADHEDSNYRMVRNALFDHISLPVSHIHRIDTGLGEAHACASAYADELQGVVPHDEDGVPVFDLMLQGIGDDGHTASLFPGTDILRERQRHVAAAYVEKFQAWRISVTFPVIDRARHVLFLVSGAGKADIIKTLLVDPPADPPFPVQMIRAQGKLEWYLDSDAALRLPEAMRAAGDDPL